MSDALAIAGVSAVLEFYLGNVYHNLSSMFGGKITLSAIAPDLVQQSFANLTATENQVNLFMHQVTYNTAWRNVMLPSLSSDGSTLLKSPPLALDLHYLLTVYGSADWQAEGLLGYALMLFHTNPVICRDDIRYALSNLPSSNNMSAALANCGLADQVEMMKITPATLGREEMAWLWTALKADYRPTFPFQVSVVLMQPQQSPAFSIPVLRRQVQAVAIQPAQILVVTPPNQQPSAAFTDLVTVTGLFLTGLNQVTLYYGKMGISFPVSANATATSLTFTAGIQTKYPGGAPAGVYTATAQLVDSSKNVLQNSNALPIALAPTVPTQAVTKTVNSDGSYAVTVANISPPVWEGQDVTLALTYLAAPPPPAPLYSVTARAQAFTGATTTTLTFWFPATLPLNVELLAGLTVDGVVNNVLIVPNSDPPAFAGPWVTVS